MCSHNYKQPYTDGKLHFWFISYKRKGNVYTRYKGHFKKYFVRGLTNYSK